MSGYKHASVTISQRAYRRLHDADMQRRYRRLERETKKRSHEEFEALRSTISAIGDRQQVYQEFLGALDTEIGQLEADTAQTLIDQQEDTIQRFALLHDDIIGSLDEVTQSLSAQIVSSQRRHIRQLVRMKRRLEGLSEERDRKINIAENWLATAIALRDFISANYDHHRFLPGNIEKIDIQIQNAVQNLHENMPEAALLGSQQAYIECSQTRLELERQISEWQIWYGAALGLVDDLYRDISSSNVVPALDLLGHELSIEIDLNQWSAGRYDSLLKRVRTLRSRINDRPNNLKIMELTDYVDNVIPGMRNEFDQIIFDARLAAIYSQIRINIADIAIQALYKQGFVVNEHGFSENDMSDSYIISMRNIEGSQVTVSVNPIQNAEVANDLVIESQDSILRTESELRSRSQEIRNSLIQYGLQVGPMKMDEVRQFNVINRETNPARSLIHQENQRDRTG